MILPFMVPYLLFILIYGSVDQHYKIEKQKSEEQAKKEAITPTQEGELCE